MLAAALLWEGAVSRRGRALGLLGAAIALVPVALRLANGRAAFHPDWPPLVLCTSLSIAVLLAAAWRGGLPLRRTVSRAGFELRDRLLVSDHGGCRMAVEGEAVVGGGRVERGVASPEASEVFHAAALAAATAGLALARLGAFL